MHLPEGEPPISTSTPVEHGSNRFPWKRMLIILGLTAAGGILPNVGLNAVFGEPALMPVDQAMVAMLGGVIGMAIGSLSTEPRPANSSVSV